MNPYEEREDLIDELCERVADIQHELQIVLGELRNLKNDNT